MQGERLNICVWMVLLAAGTVLSVGRGQAPMREAPLEGGAEEVAPDLALYAEVIHEVRAGRGYYEVAREKIPRYGFPIGSPLNWRLPTYAWVLSRLPNKCWIQAVLMLLAVGGLGLTFVAARRVQEAEEKVGTAHPTLTAGATTFFMFGVARWTFDGDAYLAQEPWAAVLIVISLAAGAMTVGWDKAAQQPAAHQSLAGRRWAGARFARWSHPTLWRCLAISGGIVALLFRELALPYCLVAGGMAAWKRRWGEAAAWALGIALFFGLFAWHVRQVRAQLAAQAGERGRESLAVEDDAMMEQAVPPKTPDPVGVAAGGGLGQWLRFGGLDFVLLTTRMNSLVFAAPAWVLWLYLLVALVGLSRGGDETSQVACLAALLYLLVFAIAGRPENFYWGLMPAPLLAWGVGRGTMAVAQMVNDWCGRNATEGVAYSVENSASARV